MDFSQFITDAVATRAPIRREFTFQGKPITGFFLDLPALHVRELLKVEGPDRDAGFLAAVVCDAAGQPVLSLDQARALKAQPLNVLLAEAFTALGLNNDGRAEAKKP